MSERGEGSAAPTGEQVLAEVRAPRERLRGALDALDDALAAPVPGRFGPWRELVEQRLGALRSAWAEHVAAAEAEDGLFADVLEREPRLAHLVELLRAEHSRLRAEVLDAAARVQGAAHEDVPELRTELLGLLTRFALHRHRGVELVYEAYSTDVSAGD